MALYIPGQVTIVKNPSSDFYFRPLAEYGLHKGGWQWWHGSEHDDIVVGTVYK